MRLYDLLCPLVGPSIHLSVRPFPFFFGVYGRFFNTDFAQMLEIAFFFTAPAHLHPTLVAVYTALLLKYLAHYIQNFIIMGQLAVCFTVQKKWC